MRVGFVGLVVALVAGCVQSSSVVCGDRVCPEHTACTQLVGLMDGSDPHRCVAPDALTACSGAGALSACNTSDLKDGVCYTTTDGAVCLAPGCGNGLKDADEACDDGNSAVGDGCSQACRSDETCGNGIVDPSKLEGGQLVSNEQCDDGNFVGHDACNACDEELAAWTDITRRTPAARVAVPLAFDTVRHRFVMFGGEVRSGSGLSFRIPQPLGDTWEGDGSSWVEQHPSISPSVRLGSGMTYDAARQRSVLFGGYDGLPRNDTWQWDGSRWSLAAPAMSPPPRLDHAIAYDSKRKVVVVFGGSADASDMTGLADTWEWNGTTWRQVSTAMSPPPHVAASMAFDPVRGVMVMAGTYATASADDYDTWEYDGTNWTPKVTTGAPQIANTMLAYDAVGHHVIAYVSAFGTQNTEVWNGTAWTNVAQVQTNRHAASLASDPASGRVVSFGAIQRSCTGGPTCGYSSSSDTWLWNGSTWTQKPLTVPEPRADAAGALDTRHRSLVLVGGYDGLTYFNDTWQLDGLTWTKFANQPWPQARRDAAAAYDSNRDELVVFGGVDANANGYSETWVRKNGTWQQKTVAGPSVQQAHSMAYDPIRRRVILFGGSQAIGGNYSAETWAWDGGAWMQLTPATSPPGRTGASLAWDPIRGELVLFGGSGGQATLADTWTWDGTNWTKHASALPPQPRYQGALVWDPSREKLVLMGGFNAGGELDDSWEWDGATWTRIVPASPPPGRNACVAASAPDGAGIVVVGGWVATSNGGQVVNGDLWRLRWDASQTYESCQLAVDADGDGKKACDDLDCWSRCTPLCPPGSTCDPSAPRCGDGICDPAVEDCRLCPTDCTTCTVACGDNFCDSGETPASCPGDCTP